MSKPLISVSVREVVAFVLRTGDLSGGGEFTGRDRAIEGTRGHQRVQKRRPKEYQAEVPVEWLFTDPEFDFKLSGRIDGVWPQGPTLVIEEIKTVRKLRPGLPDPLHSAQAKLYAAIYTQTQPWENVTIQVTYLELGTQEITQFQETFSSGELQALFEAVLNEYLTWIRDHQRWCRVRDASIREAAFPFSRYRAGQRTLAVAVYRTIKNGAKLFAEAPTGIGKTISTLFPAVKAMAEGRTEKIFYATAKTSGKKIAEEALLRLADKGVKLRRVTLTARDKICFNNGERCDAQACPHAIGYYDRVKNCLREALQTDCFGRSEIEALARRHTICPFELSLDLSLWADAIICDYNYVFDPSTKLARYFDGEKHRYAILVDESHNLIDRAREMFSAEISRTELEAARESLEEGAPNCAKAMAKICRALKKLPKEAEWSAREGWFVSKNVPTKIGAAVEGFLDEAEQWLWQDEPAPFREELLELYFQALSFRNTLERFDENYAAIMDPEATRLRLFCVDPSALLQEAVAKTGPAIFFSATLRPIDFFRATLGGSLADATLQLESPFAPEHLRVLIHDQVSTRWNERERSYDLVAESIGALLESRAGNYLVFFPSYGYLTEVRNRFEQRFPSIRVAAQSANMSEEERERFVGLFQETGAIAGFAVMGGVFGEGIDLIGDRLIGAVIVGVGLPQICLERDLVKEFAQGRRAPGFDYAYTFPGINRVLQAVGRVIRADEDRGVVLLIDDRLKQPSYRRLLPRWWKVTYVRSAEQIAESSKEFWQGAAASPLG